MLLVSRERRGLFYILVITLIERVCASFKIGKGLNMYIDGNYKRRVASVGNNTMYSHVVVI